MNDELARLKRQIERERVARKVAEELLESKSLELYTANQKLHQLAESLEAKVKERTQELESARDEALKSNQAKSDFLANISHEIRTPLNGILGILELLSEERLEAKHEKYIQTAKQSSNLLLSLINDVLDFSKIDAHKLILEEIVFNAREVIECSVTAFKHQAEKKSLQLSCDIAPNVPAYLLGDPLRIQQIITNLVGNAIKFTREGTVTIVATAKEADKIEISVRDTGVGIPQESLGTIFELFTQADMSIGRSFGGTGLGLSISLGLAQLMNGEIQVESTLEVGTCFTVVLPLASALEPTERLAATTQNASNLFEPAEVLIVDDNQVNLLVASAMLAKMGLGCQEASSGEQALAEVQRTDFDLVLMDLNMPCMDGFSTTKNIRALGGKYAKLPIVALSAQAFQTDVDLAMHSGFNDFITKPIDQNSLRQTLGQWLVKKSVSN